MSETILCRLCAHQTDNFVGIFEREGKNLDLVKKISQCLQILLFPDDVLPKEVCEECCVRLDESFKFHQCCSQAQQYLISLFSADQTQQLIKSDLIPGMDISAPLQEDIVNDQNPALDYREISLLKNSDANKTTMTIANRQNENVCDQFAKIESMNDVTNLPTPSLTDLDNVPTNSGKGDLKSKDSQTVLKTTEMKLRNRPLKNINEVSREGVDDCFDSDDGFSDSGGKDDEEQFQSRSTKGERKGWFCYECSSILPTLPSLRDHYKKEHNRQPLFKCELCEKVYERYRSYARHIKTHDDNKKYSCDVCGKHFSQKAVLKSHSTVHSGERPFPCQQCGKTFKQFSSLFMHKKSHCGSQAKFPCTVCPKSLTTKQALIVHLKNHSGERDFVCDVCGKSFVSKSSFHYHLSTHTQKKSHVCHVCGKTFSCTKLLTKHATLHTGVKPHQCDVCGKQFRLQSALKEHNRIHTGAMPYACEHCGKQFRFKGILTVHLRQHTGERPYVCSECPRTFTNWANLNKHVKRKHKNVPQSSEMSQQPAKPALNQEKHPTCETNLVNTPQLIRVANDRSSFTKHERNVCQVPNSVSKGCEIPSSNIKRCEIMSSSVHKVCDYSSNSCEIPSVVHKSCEIPSVVHKSSVIPSLVHNGYEMPSLVHKGYELSTSSVHKVSDISCTVQKSCGGISTVHKGCEMPTSAYANSLSFGYKMSENSALVNGETILRTQSNIPVTEIGGYYTSNGLHLLQNQNNLNS